ncbi:MAG: deoxyribose-phosphate aldolase [Candidatus Magasanikbacteria bacterium]|nr:deoxyribose-phosphate aldolase [Candidatus Magasanikbacteria bacterium]
MQARRKKKKEDALNVNTSLPFRLDLVLDGTKVNCPAAERRVAEIGTRRSFKKEAQVAALLRAVQCMDLTTLAGDDTPGRVDRLCAKALRPVRQEILNELGLSELNLTVGAVCVYHAQVAEAVNRLRGAIPVAAVSTSFPDGQGPMETRLAEIKASISAGATEIDIVIERGLALTGKWQALYDQIRAYRDACGDKAHLKTILGTGNLGTLTCVAQASAVAIMAGADFIKTSTGKEGTNATLPVSLTMVRQIRRFQTEVDSGRRIGFKPAGGIKTAKDAMLWLSLMLEELGEEWTHPELFRFGASSLLTDLELQLEHCATGKYAAVNHQPLA